MTSVSPFRGDLSLVTGAWASLRALDEGTERILDRIRQLGRAPRSLGRLHFERNRVATRLAELDGSDVAGQAFLEALQDAIRELAATRAELLLMVLATRRCDAGSGSLGAQRRAEPA